MAFELQDTKVSPVENKMSLMEKLGILSDAAKYDVSCSSSGVGRRGDGTGIGNTLKAGICHSFGADGRCISLLKILFTNECIYDCKYCINRRSNDVPRASFTPDEICELTIQFYRRNYIEGLFLQIHNYWTIYVLFLYIVLYPLLDKRGNTCILPRVLPSFHTSLEHRLEQFFSKDSVLYLLSVYQFDSLNFLLSV